MISSYTSLATIGLGIDDPILNWVSSFLKYREQQVVVDGEFSDSTNVGCGVPQGTILGPLLFLIHINDILTGISSNLRLFADDCLLYQQMESPDDQLVMQGDLNALA